MTFLRGQDGFNHHYLNAKLRYHRAFRERRPDLAAWFGEPLVERVGRLPGESYHRPSFAASHKARPYLTYLGLRGYATFDNRWIFAVGQLRVHDQAALAGIDLGTTTLVEEAAALGYSRPAANQAMHWSVARIVLRNGLADVADITGEQMAEVLEAIRLFPEDPEFASFYPSARQFYEGPAKCWITHLHQLKVVLFHRGQAAAQPRKLMPSWRPPLALPPRMLAVAEKWLAARRLTDAPSTADKLELAIRVFGQWLAEHHPTSPPSPTSRATTASAGLAISPRHRPRGQAHRWVSCRGSSGSPGCRSSSGTPRSGSTPMSPDAPSSAPVTRPSTPRRCRGSSPTRNSTG
ncbi:hypothetical protein [Streptomyces sp. OE57]|uniref:hypothetical protein n=1 Tax=Streptomyces lacaronensis TaxID=3379885 RepID=UPI0039B78251